MSTVLPQALNPNLNSGVQRLASNLNSVVLGKTEIVDLVLIGLLAEGHLLLEDVPGTGKSLLGKAIAKSIEAVFHRIQFTPDLLPSDLIGTSVFDQKRGEFTFQKGPIFGQVILADEINRATPRTQSALLEAMGDKRVTVDGVTRDLGPPFFVIATQNPFEFEGTYPLPESQLDRFLIRTSIGYADAQAEKRILREHRLGEPVDDLKAVLTTTDLIQIQAAVREIPVETSLEDYLIEIVRATRRHPALRLGASMRSSLGLYRAAQAKAFLCKRAFVLPDDIKHLASPVLSHRIHPRRGQGSEAIRAAEEVVADILEKTPCPR